MAAPIGKLVESYSGFDPRTIPGCAAWYDAADSSTVTLSGANVSKWFDKSSRSNALIPTGDATRTAYSNVINGLNTVSVNGETNVTAGLSNSNAFSLAQPNTCFAVVRTRRTDFAGTFSLIFGTNCLIQYRNQFASNMSMWAGTADVSQGNNIRFTSNATRTHVAIFSSNVTSFLGADGTVFTTGANPGTGGWTSLQPIGTTPGVTQQGDCGEIIMYSGLLSSNDRQIVEGYLNWKWGLPSNLPATHPYRGYVQPFTRPFSPLDVPNCGLWLDAADRSTILTNGTSTGVAQWNDKSGNQYNLTIGTPANYPTYSNGVVNFSAASSQRLCNTTANIFTTSAGGGHTTFAVMSHSAGRMFGLSGSSNQVGLDSSGCDLMVSGFANRYSTATTLFTPRIGTRHLRMVQGSSSIARQYSVNGGNFTNFENAVAATGSGNAFVVGAGAGVGSTSYATGHICEIIAYTSYLPSNDVRRVEGYLAAKWGLRGDISGGNPFKSLPPFYPAFTPLQISNCVTWLDAADISGLTLSGSNVTSWIDKSGNGNSCSQATASNQPTYLSTDRSVNFNISNFLVSTYTPLVSNGSISIFAAFTPTAVGTRENTMFGTSGTAQGNLAIVTNQQSTHGNFGINSASRGFGSFTVRTTFSNLTSVGLITISNGTNIAYANGGSAAASVTLTFSNAPFVIGGYFGASTLFTGDSYIGKVHEVLLYNRIVTTSERYRIEGYLANKWNVGLVQTTAVPTDYSNCALWLDAADISSIDLSGSNVTVWRDKSGNNYNASNSANKGPTYSGGVLNFNGTSNSLSVPTFSMPSSTHCLIAVHRPTTISGNNQGNTNVFRWQGPYYIVFPYMNGTTPRGYVTSADTSVLDALTSTLVERSVTTGYNVITANIANGSQLIYRNGVLMSSNTQPMNTQTQSNFAIGSTVDTLSEFYQGSIAEMIIFTRQLTSNERTAIENRLISKWNALGLPSQHPYKNSIA
jgi:hypothetical protein